MRTRLIAAASAALIVGIAPTASAGWRGHNETGDYNGRHVVTGITGRHAGWNLYVNTPGDKNPFIKERTVAVICHKSGSGQATVRAQGKLANGNWGYREKRYTRYHECEHFFLNPETRWVRFSIDGVRNGKGFQNFDVWAPPHRETR